MKYLEDARILENSLIRPDIQRIRLLAPKIASAAKPGQFLHVRVRDSFVPLLRRPLSIGRVKGETIELVWRIVGKGTALLAKLREEETLNLLGPLGRPFSMPEKAKVAVLVAGGLGLPPLAFLKDALEKKGVQVRLLLGVADENAIPLTMDDPLLAEMSITCENTDRFRRGLVTEPTAELLSRLQTDGMREQTALYSCGPWGLVRALQKIVPAKTLEITEVSLEQRMACGIGVCQGCAIQVRDRGKPYRLVCSDGPVFPLHEVEIDNAG